MECYVCGRNIGKNLGMCEQCKHDRQSRGTPSIHELTSSHTDTNEAAGFWLRSLAYVIDGCLIAIVYGLFSVLIFQPLLQGILPDLFGRWADDLSGRTASGAEVSLFVVVFGLLIGMLLTFIFGSILVGVLYCALFESSTLMATPGKLLLDLKTSDLEDNRLSFRRAVLRSITKGITMLFLGLGFIFIGLSPDKRGLHDLFSGSRVFKGSGCSWGRVILAIPTSIILFMLCSYIFPSSKDRPKAKNNSLSKQLSPTQRSLKEAVEADMSRDLN